MPAFHEVTFPLDIALGASGGPERRTDVVLLGSGAEERNARWAHSRRRYDAGYGVKSLAGLQAVVAFFEERRGRLHGFRFRDRLDHASAQPGAAPSPVTGGRPVSAPESAPSTSSRTVAEQAAPAKIEAKRRETARARMGCNGASTPEVTRQRKVTHPCVTHGT